jgi:pimeloyl-ACP methyl ester carboxylesterase
MTSGTATVDGIELAYETFGDPADPTVLLVMGLGVQMLGWDEAFCAQLAERGFHVVRFDNRDCGLSTHMHDAPHPDVLAAMRGDFSCATYTLADMADDTAGLIAALGLADAHVVGVSMGGMIAQMLAIRHPERVRSMTLVMTTTGRPGVGGSTPEALQTLLAAPPTDREAIAERAVSNAAVVGSPAYPQDPEVLRERARRAYDRSYDPRGVGRQLVGILATGDRTAALAGLDVPTVVVHGAADPLVDASGGQALAEVIPGAELDVVDGMGHDLPPALWPRLIERIEQAVQRGEARRHA